MPGIKGTVYSVLFCSKDSVSPGLIINSAPDSIACAYCVALATVPAPTIALGTCSFTIRIASSPHSVRKVISNTLTPALTKALANGTASFSCLIAITGIIGEDVNTSNAESAVVFFIIFILFYSITSLLNIAS